MEIEIVTLKGVKGKLIINGTKIKNSKNQRVIIYKDSPIIENPITRPRTQKETVRKKKQIIEKRNDLINARVLSEKKFLQDHEFKSLNAAAEIIFGRDCSAYDDFGVLENDGFISLNKKYFFKKRRNEKLTSLNNEEVIRREEVDVNVTISEELKKESLLSENVIFYGVPGCGKSYYVNSLLGLNEEDENKKLNAKFYKRILFHPEYSYSDFVGQLVPQTDADGRIKYEFKAGPFVEILKDAYTDPYNHYFLIIEEINRGNAPAIFGDLFQLLDRIEGGESEYGIYNSDILSQLQKCDVQIREVKIPKNLTIFATMNTCDQNVFTMDTAFKRRWRPRRIKNDFHSFAGAWAETPLFEKGEWKITWKEFGIAVNDAVIKYCDDGTAEDKQLGTYFVKKKDLANIQAFAEKVLMYLWDDVVKYDRARLFKARYLTLDEVIEDFVKGEDVFAEPCEKLHKLYENRESSPQLSLETE